MCAFLSAELSEQTFKTWLAPVQCLSFTETSLVLSVPDNYFGIWLKNHYESMLKSAAADILGKNYDIQYQVLEPSSPPEPSPAVSAASLAKTEALASFVQELGLNRIYTFDQFVIGQNNRFAHAAAMAVCDAPAKNYNPLFIYGPVGLGKTHLMQAVAQEIKRRNPEFKILYITSEKFTNQLIAAIQTKTTQQFRNRYRTLDLLLIDDIHFIAEKESTQEEFFHTFNALYDAHKQIIVSSDRPPREIPGLEERLVSRFGWGLVADIQPPDFETRVAILRKKMEKETFSVPDDVAYFIASKIKSNIRELEGALTRVVAYCTLTGEPLVLRVAQEVLKASLKEEEKKIGMEKIQRVVSDFYGVTVSDLRSKKRNRSVARPRQIAVYLTRLLTDHSLPEIGEYLGGRDHSTIIHSFQKIEKELQENGKTKNEIEELKRKLSTDI
ncbi:MAG: chromosomal replication initiator protein DnaA [Candidatus Omnitrophota bacterium]